MGQVLSSTLQCLGLPDFDESQAAPANAPATPKAASEGDREHAHAHEDKFGQLVSDGDGHRVFENAYYEAREEAEAKAQLMHQESHAANAAFNQGAKADAHKHSVLSKEYRQEMEQVCCCQRSGHRHRHRHHYVPPPPLPPSIPAPSPLRTAAADATIDTAAVTTLRTATDIQANARAAATILEPQNLKTSRKLDLHGLYVKEAEHAVEEFLK